MLKINKYSIQDVQINKFFQLPQFLFTEKYAHLSNDAKVLYSLLKDRHNLSVNNGWHDNNGNIFIIFTREEMAKILHCKQAKVRKCIKELKELKLLTETRQGLNKPNLIYLYYPEIDLNSGLSKNDIPERTKSTPNYTYNNYTNNNIRECRVDTQRAEEPSLTVKDYCYLVNKDLFDTDTYKSMCYFINKRNHCYGKNTKLKASTWERLFLNWFTVEINGEEKEVGADTMEIAIDNFFNTKFKNDKCDYSIILFEKVKAYRIMEIGAF